MSPNAINVITGLNWLFSVMSYEIGMMICTKTSTIRNPYLNFLFLATKSPFTKFLSLLFAGPFSIDGYYHLHDGADASRIPGQ